jgi:hypothetical protein
VNLAEIPSNAADSYGGRLRGWVTAPQTGDYTFFIAGDDSAELWLSSDNSRFNRQLIAFSRNPTASRQWNKFASQRSQVIRLVQGQAYYLEAWLKENTSSDHLAVGWQMVDVPSYTSSNWASATGTWTETAAGGYAFSVASGALGGASDSASRAIRSWTGDGEFVVNLEQLAGSTNTAQVGLMLRIDAAANGRHVFIGRNVAGQSSYVRRTTLGGSTSTTLGSLNGKFLRLVRSGNIISASVSADGIQWVSAGTSVTFTSLPATLEVSLVAAAVTANPATPVTGTFSQLVARPLNATEVIPGTSLTPNAADAADSGDKTIPDAWQIVNGLVPSERFGANGPYGDPDQDGLENWREFSYGFDPYEADSINGLITRELWVNIPGINQVIDLTNHNRFFETPDAIDLVSGVDFYFGGELTNSFGARYRGEITAPKTGYFRFWITAPDDAQLWLADGSIKRPGDSLGLSSRFGKRKIASVWGTGYFTSRAARYNYDAFACQQSEPVWLAQGQKYFFEVLHKTRSHEMNHVSVAWQPPGESRTLIPASAYSHHLPSLVDADDDYLPNTWESIFGLNPSLNGRTDRRQAQDGDYDADTISNLREYQLGTNPTNADTDGDGLRDDFELLNGLDPTNPTTIHGVPDKWLVTYFPELLTSGLQNFNSTDDSDGDGLSNHQEAALGTNPNNVDSDGDGQNDNVDSAPRTAAEYGLVNPTFDATPTENPLRRWPATGPATASLYPVNSIPGWSAHTNEVIELRHETSTDNIVELHAHWTNDAAEMKDTGHGVTQSFEMLPGTTRTYILRYKGRANSATVPIVIADNEFSLKLTGGTLKVDGTAVPTGEKSYTGTVDEFKYSVIEFSVPAGSAAPGQAPAQALTLEITPSQNADSNTYGAWIDLLPVEFETFAEGQTGPIGGNRSPNWKPHNLNLNTRQKEKDHYADFDKCVAHVWSSDKLNMAKYLAGYSGHKVLFENPEIINWKVDGVKQDSFELDMGDQPADNLIIEFKIEVLAKGVDNPIDSMIVTVVPLNTVANFAKWVVDNQDLSWLNSLPALYHSVSIDGSGKAQNPEPSSLACAHWKNNKPLSLLFDMTTDSYYHPDAYHEIRSEEVNGEYGHQACYKEQGGLIRGGISAGTADKIFYGKNPGGANSHVNLDVIPFVWALQLDGTPAQGEDGIAFDYSRIDQPIMHEGWHIGEYLKLRPPIANNKPELAPGTCP